MDGSTASVIVIPIVIVISLAAWLIVVAWAASHAEWRGRNQASAQGKPGPAAPADQHRPDASPAAPADAASADPALADPDQGRVHRKAA
jgi:Mg-chelatase subunit ChlI